MDEKIRKNVAGISKASSEAIISAKAKGAEKKVELYVMTELLNVSTTHTRTLYRKKHLVGMYVVFSIQL